MNLPLKNRPIGIFDSGLGGLTAVKELERLLPSESFVYFGDTGRIPYGTKSNETIRRYAAQDIRFLRSHQVKAILVACGTVSSVAGDVCEASGVPTFNVLGATAAAACRTTKNRRIAVIGTPATIASGAYRKALLTLDSDLFVRELACPMFVPLVENGYLDPADPVVRLVVARSLAQIPKDQVDTLILGCTHFPLLSAAIANQLGTSVTLINSGREAAAALAAFLVSADLLKEEPLPTVKRYYVSDTARVFSTVAATFLGHSVCGETAQINIESY